MSERIDHVRALVGAGPYSSVDSIVYVEALRQVIEAYDATSAGIKIWAKRAELAETKLGRVVAICERAGQHYNTCTGAAGELRSRILYSATKEPIDEDSP